MPKRLYQSGVQPRPKFALYPKRTENARIKFEYDENFQNSPNGLLSCAGKDIINYWGLKVPELHAWIDGIVNV